MSGSRPSLTRAIGKVFALISHAFHFKKVVFLGVHDLVFHEMAREAISRALGTSHGPTPENDIPNFPICPPH